MTDQTQIRLSHVLLASGFVATGALGAIWAPIGLVGVLALAVLMRICWLEDNINNDLLDQDRLPGGYINTAIERGNWLRRWLQIEPGEDVTTKSPHQLATSMRAEVQIWGCVLLGLTATLTAKSGPFSPLMNGLVGAAILVIALRRADRLTVSLAHCAEGRALPKRLLEASRPWMLR